jgi:chorismate synthase
MSYAVEMKSGWARSSAIEDVMETVTKTDPDTAKAMISSIRSPEVRAEASGILAGQLAKADVEQAKAWVYSLGGDARAEADVELAQTISYRDDDGARAWVEQIDNAETRAEAVGAVIQTVSRADPFATAEWLTQFPMTTEYDVARRKFALAITSVDPDAAREWASSIVDAKSRSYWSKIVDEDIAENR